MKQGEIWLVELFETKGHEQFGARPAVILADASMNVVIVVPFTSNLKALRYPFVLQINPTEKNGLSASSIALVFQVRAIDKIRLIKKVGDLEDQRLKDILKILKKLFRL